MNLPARWLLTAGAAILLAGCAAAPVDSGEPVATDMVDLPPSYRFAPEVITVAAGTTVTWTNNDNFTHNVQFAQDEPLTMRPGESVSTTFTEPGTHDYICSLHATEMQGSVLVTAD